MAQNPYYVDPGNDYSTGLSGLSNALSGVRQSRIQQAEQDRLQQAQQLKQDQYDRANQRFLEVQDAAQKAYASNNPDLIAATAVKYPEITQMLQGAIGLKTDLQNKDASDFVSQFATAAPEDRQSIIEKRAQMLQAQGRDASHTLQSLEDFKANPEAETNHIINAWAGVNPVAYKAFSDQQKQQAKQNDSDRNYGLEQAKMGQQMTIAQMNSHDRALGRQVQMLNAQQASTTNDLKRQELQQKIDRNTKAQQDNGTNAYSTANNAVSTFDDTLQNINQIKNAPGLSGNFGKMSYIPNRRGSDSADAQAMIDTLKGKAFLAAFNSLKGGGQITEIEGTKATNAMLNMENAQSEEQFRKNLAVFQGVIERGKKVAAQQAAKYSVYAPKPDQGAAAPASSGASGGWEIIK